MTLDTDPIGYIADNLANRFLGERLPIDFGGIPSGHKVQLFHLKRIAIKLIQTDGNPDTDFMPLSPLRMLAIATYERCLRNG